MPPGAGSLPPTSVVCATSSSRASTARSWRAGTSPRPWPAFPITTRLRLLRPPSASASSDGRRPWPAYGTRSRRVGDRIVMLVRNVYTHDTRVEKEARTLTDAGFEVTVVADAAPGLPERETRDGSTVIRVPRTAAAAPGLRFFLQQARLARVLRRLQPAVLHAHDTNALIPVALAARALGIPFVYDAHDLWLGRPRRERSRIYFAMNQLFYSLVERLIVPRAAA